MTRSRWLPLALTQMAPGQPHVTGPWEVCSLRQTPGALRDQPAS